MNEFELLLPIIDQSIAFIFATLVWYELRSMRKQAVELLNIGETKTKDLFNGMRPSKCIFSETFLDYNLAV